MSKLLPTVMQISASRCLAFTPCQGAKIARRIEKQRAAETKGRPRITTAQQDMKYCLDYIDNVGEEAVANVMAHNAERRLNEKKTASADTLTVLTNP